jgi:hypothetical protein
VLSPQPTSPGCGGRALYSTRATWPVEPDEPPMLFTPVPVQLLLKVELPLKLRVRAMSCVHFAPLVLVLPV